MLTKPRQLTRHDEFYTDVRNIMCRTKTNPTHIRPMVWTTWWLWRGAYTRSHPELGRENPQRPWYCVSRHGRVGRRQVLQTIANNANLELVSSKTLQNQSPNNTNAGWSSPVARQAHNLKVIGSNPIPATTDSKLSGPARDGGFFFALVPRPLVPLVPSGEAPDSGSLLDRRAALPSAHPRQYRRV